MAITEIIPIGNLIHFPVVRICETEKLMVMFIDKNVCVVLEPGNSKHTKFQIIEDIYSVTGARWQPIQITIYG